MSFNFSHRPSRKKDRPWYESLFWGPLVIALVGAFIAASAQITATILPIYFGPPSLCDFSITIEPSADTITVYEDKVYEINKNISVIDLHPLIKPYKHPVYVKIIGTLPKGVIVILQGFKGGRLPLNIQMTIQINNTEYIPGEHEIQIQGIGEDGIKRNCTYFLNLKKGYRLYLPSREIITVGGNPSFPVGNTARPNIIKVGNKDQPEPDVVYAVEDNAVKPNSIKVGNKDQPEPDVVYAVEDNAVKPDSIKVGNTDQR